MAVPSDKKPRKVTLDLILASTSLSRTRQESNDSFLERLTHLHLQNKRIRRIARLERCLNLKVLYLYDNMIEAIENLEFASKLQYLHLENNVIKSIPPLGLSNLVKLYLDENEITVVRGLESCVRLEELHVAKQRLPPQTPLRFEKTSLTAISQTLVIMFCILQLRLHLVGGAGDFRERTDLSIRLQSTHRPEEALLPRQR